MFCVVPVMEKIEEVTLASRITHRREHMTLVIKHENTAGELLVCKRESKCIFNITVCTLRLVCVYSEHVLNLDLKVH